MSLHNVPVENSEVLARVVHSHQHIRKADCTVRAEAFLPFRRIELSVIRHRELRPSELWEICGQIAVQRVKPLIGMADILAENARQQSLEVEPREGDSMPRNHADIVGWPPEKPAQMIKAVALAARSKFTANAAAE